MRKFLTLFLLLVFAPFANLVAQDNQTDEKPPVDAPVITITGVAKQLYNVTVKSPSDNEAIWVESNNKVQKHFLKTANVYETIQINPVDGTVKLYGDITSFTADNQVDPLIGIDASNHPLLEEIDCQNSEVTFVKVANCPNLQELLLFENKIEVLDVTTCPSLVTLQCQKNQIALLDLSQNTLLEEVDCSNNKLKALDLTNCKSLQRVLANTNEIETFVLPKEAESLAVVEASENKIATIDVSGHPQLEELGLSTNNLTSIDLSKNTFLETLWLDANDLKEVDLSKQESLKNLHIYEQKNGLKELDLRGCVMLEMLYAYGNKSTKIDVSTCEELLRIECYDNQLTELDFSKNVFLVEAWCGNNQLTSFVVNDNPELRQLGLSNNKLTTLSLVSLKNLVRLEADGNELTSLELPLSRGANYIQLANNKLEAVALNAVYETLNDVHNPDFPVFKDLFIANNPGRNSSNVKMAFDKHWRVDDKAEYNEADFTASETIAQSALSIVPQKGAVSITSIGESSFVCLYDLSGKLLVSVRLGANEEYTISLPSGAYIAKYGDFATKLFVE